MSIADKLLWLRTQNCKSDDIVQSPIFNLSEGSSPRQRAGPMALGCFKEFCPIKRKGRLVIWYSIYECLGSARLLLQCRKVGNL
jgi:hypothetical protein